MVDAINAEFEKLQERYRNDNEFRIASDLFSDGYADEYVRAFVDLDDESIAAARKFGAGMKRLIGAIAVKS